MSCFWSTCTCSSCVVVSCSRKEEFIEIEKVVDIESRGRVVAGQWANEKGEFCFVFLDSAFPVVPKITTPLTTKKFDLIAYIPYIFLTWMVGWMDAVQKEWWIDWWKRFQQFLRLIIQEKWKRKPWNSWKRSPSMTRFSF